MIFLAIALAVISGAIAFIHLIWAFGSTWPQPNEAALARTVVGRERIQHMPPKLASAFVAVMLTGVALWALVLGGLLKIPVPMWLVMQGGLIIAAIFITRGAMGLMPFFRRAMPEEPFARLNRHYYSPLCLVLGFGYGFLTVFGLTGLI